MDKFTIYCTEAQTKKALELGAPIEVLYSKADYLQRIPTVSIKGEYVTYDYFIPTAEQMIGWLENEIPVSEDFLIKQIIVESYFNGKWNYFLGIKESENYYISRKEATLAAIDAALDYLIKTKVE